ncbi:MAG: hypothetical protein O2818_06395 [Bacteroidetes bacterium]|nr:hypothetical protein [Bacteroidota bacterium]
MKNFLTLLFLALVSSVSAQITSVGCDSMALVVNVGSQETALNLYHPGGYLTWPPSENVMEWLFTDEEGNVVHEETLIDENFVSFGHNVPVTDTMFVSVLLTNDSSIYYDGNPVACLIEDYLTWEEEEIIPGTFIGAWTLGGAVGTYAGEPSGIGEVAFGFPSTPRKLVSILDITGREVNPEPNQLLFFIYDDGSVEKRFVVERR